MITTARERLVLTLLIVVALARIVATYGVFSQTWDEPVHVATAMRWLEGKPYDIAAYNPPLGRLLLAIPLRLTGAHSLPPRPHSGMHPIIDVGNQLFYAGGKYVRNLTLARIGNLFWFLVACTTVWWWARSLFGVAAGLASLLVFTNVPHVLALAGLATNEMASCAAINVAILIWCRWLRRGDAVSACLCGAALGAAIGAKFLALLYLPPILLIAAVLMRKFPWRSAALIPLAAFLVLWPIYRFSVLPAREVPRFASMMRSNGRPIALAFERLHLPLPASELVAGIDAVGDINAHPVYVPYFFGETRSGGWWSFFPVVLAIKTPLAILLLFLLGVAIAPWSVPSAAAASMLVTSTFIHLDPGLRYLLPIFVPLSVAAGCGAAALLQRSRLAAAAVFALILLPTLAVHPDYLAYFNAVAGSHPERIVVDSDLDWGQDLLRLAKVVDRRGIRELSLAYFGTAEPERHIHARLIPFLPDQHPSGWIGISEMYRRNIGNRSGDYSWIRAHEPVEKIGRICLPGLTNRELGRILEG